MERVINYWQIKFEIWLAKIEQNKEQLQTIRSKWSKKQIQLKDLNNKNGEKS